MSVNVLSRVWESNLPPNQRLVLLAYADAAEHDGTEIWPGWDRVSSMTGYSQATVGRITRDLKDLGVLIQELKGYKGRRAKYRIDLDHPCLKANQNNMLSEESLSSEPESLSSEPESLSRVITLPSSSSVLSSRPSSEDDKSSNRDLLWEAVVEIHGDPATRSERGKFNKAVSMLREADVSPGEYPLLVQAYCAKHDNLQPAVMTVASRVGEMRHFLSRGPLVGPSVEQVSNRAWAAAFDAQQLEGGR